MDVIKKGTDDVNELASFACCWPPYTNKMDASEPE